MQHDETTPQNDDQTVIQPKETTPQEDDVVIADNQTTIFYDSQSELQAAIALLADRALTIADRPIASIEPYYLTPDVVFFAPFPHSAYLNAIKKGHQRVIVYGAPDFEGPTYVDANGLADYLRLDVLNAYLLEKVLHKFEPMFKPNMLDKNSNEDYGNNLYAGILFNYSTLTDGLHDIVSRGWRAYDLEHKLALFGYTYREIARRVAGDRVKSANIRTTPDGARIATLCAPDFRDETVTAAKHLTDKQEVQLAAVYWHSGESYHVRCVGDHAVRDAMFPNAIWEGDETTIIMEPI